MTRNGRRDQTLSKYSPWLAAHTDPNNPQHAADKERNRLLRKIKTVVVEINPEDGVHSYGAPPPGGGWTFLIQDRGGGMMPGSSRVPVVVPGDVYSRELAMVHKTRRRYIRQIERERFSKRLGKLVTQRFRTLQTISADDTPLRQIVSEPPPWVSKLWRENLPIDVQQECHLRVLKVVQKKLEETGVEMIGGGVHQDEDHDHYHTDFSIIDATARKVPKERLKVYGKWASRTERQLDWKTRSQDDLSGEERDWLDAARKKRKDGIDLQIARAIDAECRAICKELHLDLAGAVSDYVRWQRTVAEVAKRKAREKRLAPQTLEECLDVAFGVARTAHALSSGRVEILPRKMMQMALAFVPGSVAASVVLGTAAVLSAASLKECREKAERYRIEYDERAVDRVI